MPAINLREVEADLFWKLKAAASQEKKSLREWAILVLSEKVSGDYGNEPRNGCVGPAIHDTERTQNGEQMEGGSVSPASASGDQWVSRRPVERLQREHAERAGIGDGPGLTMGTHRTGEKVAEYAPGYSAPSSDMDRPERITHNTKTCRLRNCGMCLAAKTK